MTSITSNVFSFLFVLCLPIGIVSPKNFKAHIVESPSNYGFRQQYPNAIPGSSPLKPKRAPAPFFGPTAFRSLSGKCFALEKGQYEWKLCPFYNVTQQETGSSWNPYRGVLGIWAGWKVDVANNAFRAMSMTDGDDCGTSGPRQVEVNLSCGSKESLTSVEEPKTCRYSMDFESPVFCREENLGVYPNLDEELRKSWDKAFTEWKTGLLTWKGYDRAVKDLLVQSGAIRTADDLLVQSGAIRTADDLLVQSNANPAEISKNSGKNVSDVTHIPKSRVRCEFCPCHM